LVVKSITAPYFLATKIGAFKDRGNSDYLSSHDLEDIITVIGGRVGLADEIVLANDTLKEFLKNSLKGLLRNNQFLLALPGHVNEGPSAVTEQRVRIILNRMKEIIG